MELTAAQLDAIASGRSIRFEHGGTVVIALRADLYERLSDLAYDDSSWSAEEMDALAAEDADALGWEGMEVHQDDDQ